MAVNIGPKIGIDGEAEYRKQINNIIQQAKTLSSEMKKVTSSFTSETSAQDRAAAKSAVLNKQIEVQKKRVSELEKMLEKAREEFGDTANETLKWEQAVNDATTELNKLEAELKETEGETEEFGETAEESGEKTNEAAEKWRKVGKVAGTVGKAMGVAVAAIAAGIIKLGGAMLNNVKDTAQWADEITTMSKVAGVSTKALQRFEYASGFVDVSIDKIVDSLGEITASMADARSGAGDAADAYSRLGVSVTNADGSLRDSEAVFYDVIDALGEVENETERDAIAFKVFGESARELNPLIEAGADRLRELGIQAEDMGYVLSEDALNGLVGVSDAMDRLSGAAESMKRNLGAAFAPFLVTIAEQVLPAIEDIAGSFAQVLNGDMSVSSFVEELLGYLDQLVQGISENGEEIAGEVGDIVQTVTQAINEAAPMLNTVVITIIEVLLKTVIECLPSIIETVLQMVIQVATSLGEFAEYLIPAILTCIGVIIETIVGNIWQIIGSGTQLIEGIITGILQGIPQLSQMAPQIISTFVMGLIQNLPQIFAQGIGIILELITGLIAGIPELIMALPEVIGAIWEAFQNADWSEIGNDITDGIQRGIVEKWNNLVQTVLGKGQELINRFKRLFGIKSPSRVFADEVGKMIPAGIAVGIDEATPKMLRDATNSIGQLSNVPLYNYGGVNLTVYGAQGQDVNALADVIMQKMQHAVNRKEAVFA